MNMIAGCARALAVSVIAGHGTTGQAKFWKKELADLLQSTPRGSE